MKKHNVLHIIPTVNGGVGQVVEDLLTGCSDEFNMSLLVLGNIERINVKKLNEKGVVINNWGLSNFKNPFLTIKLFKYIKNNNIEIVHVHLFPALYWLALVSLFLRKVKFIYTEHSSNNNRNKWWLKPIEKFMYSRYDIIVAVSESVAEMLKKRINFDSVCVINNGFEMRQIPNELSVSILKERYKNNKIISMASRFVDGKDFKTLIDAIDLLDDSYQLLLIGDGLKHSIIKSYIDKKNLNKKVNLLGYRNDVLDIFGASDIVILSSAFEGLPIVVLESIAVNTPCLGSNVSGISDVLCGTDFLFEFGDVEGLANKIEYIIKNKNSLKLKAQLEEIKVRFDISKTTEKYKCTYRSLEI
ncbi:glycosyltransferase [Ancylomarina sp. 16SWW S1-10-2]|uniref:glycosyltransferase n=1 Tax=Ancylomarina sp. 16SWW S1-10-2 TaxID=2499681 RepID=UPI0012ADC9F6|nr:glycosyltransferase [Ancylomarina sp. 16SWW S1-10-2]MRT94807.1 glycosyltransferase [Ancylomarina sp. 16SWW S1-10-2]